MNTDRNFEIKRDEDYYSEILILESKNRASIIGEIVMTPLVQPRKKIITVRAIKESSNTEIDFF